MRPFDDPPAGDDGPDAPDEDPPPFPSYAERDLPVFFAHVFVVLIGAATGAVIATPPLRVDVRIEPMFLSALFFSWVLICGAVLLLVVLLVASSLSDRNRTGDLSIQSDPLEERIEAGLDPFLALFVGAVVGSIAVGLLPESMSAELVIATYAVLVVLLATGGAFVDRRSARSLLYGAAGGTMAVAPWGFVGLFVVWLLENLELVEVIVVVATAPVLAVPLFVLVRGYARLAPRTLDGRVGVVIIVVCLVATPGIVAYDLGGEQPDVKFDPATTAEDPRVEMVNIDDTGNKYVVVPIGSVVVENRFPFAQVTEVGPPEACLYGFRMTRHEVVLDNGGPLYFGPKTVQQRGKSTRELEAFFVLDHEYQVEDSQRRRVDGLPVRVAESCPDDVGEPQIVVVPPEHSDE